MEIRDISKEQINSADQRQTLEKYRDCFEEIREFGPEDHKYLRTTRKRVEKLNEDLAQKGCGRLKEITEKKINRVQNKIPTEKTEKLL